MKTENRNGVEWTILEGNDSWVARGSSHVEAWESSHVVAWESSHVEAWGSSHVVAWGSSHVVARESSHVVARESSHVEARGSSHVEARESSHVVARESSHVVAWDFSAIHQFSSECKIKKGPKATVIKPNYPSNIKDWSKLKGLVIKKNRIYLYKVLRLNGTDFHTGTINYLKEAVAPDWDNKFKEECGRGLHLADSPEGAKYFLQDKANYLLIEVNAALKDCKPFPGQAEYPMKLRARACRFERIIEKVENGKKVI